MRVNASVCRWSFAASVLTVSALLACGSESKSKGRGEPDGGPPTGTGQSSSATIGPDGGVVEVGGARLTVPEGALARETVIEIVSTREAAGMGLVNRSPLYRFSPSGLSFLRAAEVAIDFAGTADDVSILWSDSAESRFDVLPTTIEGTTAHAEVTHFSVGFAGYRELGPGTPDGGPVDSDAGMSGNADGGSAMDAGGTDATDSSPDGPVTGIQCTPVDLFVLVQATGAMAEDSPDPSASWWDLVVDQLGTFFNHPQTEGMRAAMSSFGGSLTPMCAPSAYQTLDVALGDLPEHALPLTTSLQAQTPVGGTPLSEAFEGIASVAVASAQANPSHRTAIVFVTNANASACNTDNAVQATAALAADALSSRAVPTFVLGAGTALSSLNDLATAGGTSSAILLTNPDAAYALLDSINALRTCDP